MSSVAPLRTFGRIKGRPLKPRQTRLLETLLPQLAAPPGPFEPATLAPGAAETWLEVGKAYAIGSSTK